MYSEYSCGTCHFRTTPGWYHFHDFSKGYGSASMLMCSRCGAPHLLELALESETLAAFRRSAVPWEAVLVEAGPNRVQVMYALLKLLGCSRQQAQSWVREVPVRVARWLQVDEAQKLRAELEAIGARVLLSSEFPRDLKEGGARFIPQQQDVLSIGIETPEGMDWRPCEVRGERSGPEGRILLEVQECARCHATGTLISGLPAEVNPCPRCGQLSLQYTGGGVS